MAYSPPPDPPQPTQPVPTGLRETRRYDDVLMVAGQGPIKEGGLMLMFTAPTQQEASDSIQATTGGTSIRDRARYLKGPPGIYLKDIISAVHIDPNTAYVSSLIKWALPKARRFSPNASEISLARDCMDREIREVKPSIIVAFGKAAFEFLVDIRMRHDDTIAGVFWSEKYQSRVMAMEHPYLLESRPDYRERFMIYFKVLAQLVGHDGMKPIQQVELNYRVVTCRSEVIQLVADLEADSAHVISPDCEWSGNNHVDGKLRSLQLAWRPGYAAYIKFMDQNGNYTMDISYAEVGAILATWLNRRDVKYVGHHVSADLPWMHCWLGLDWYGKTLMDTEFALQCIDEHQPHGLEWLSLRTDLGRYDIELELHKKEIKLTKDEGYGRIHDDVIIPYGLRDADVCIRVWPQLWRELEHQDLTDYYVNILNPFCTDVFTNFVILGIPMDVEQLDTLRDLYSYATEQMTLELQRRVQAEAKEILADRLRQHNPDQGEWTASSILASYIDGDHTACWGYFDLQANETDPARADLIPVLEHLFGSANFNIRSQPDMKRWLFDVKKYVPVKSTGNKSKGMPSMAWEKILQFDAKRQKEFTPAVDKQSLQIISEQNQDAVLKYLLMLNAVGNIKKGCLKEPTLDEETGETTRENGLHYWLCSDMRVHGQLSLTETGRPRSWKPNTLNWSSHVIDDIRNGIRMTFELLHSRGELPERFHKYLGKERDTIPSIRSCAKAPPKWCLVESDFITAEIRGLAYISGDANLMRLLNDPDRQFAKVKDGHFVRIQFDENSGIAPAMRRPEFILAFWEKGNLVCQYGTTDLLWDGGNLLHPKHDLHWSLAEGWQNRPRELMDPDIDRKSGKIGNFSTAYGAAAASIERKIEADTGSKPEPGTGQKILDALDKRQPVAFAFLRSMEDIQFEPGYYRCASGRIRHFKTHPQWSRVGRRILDSLAAGQAREARNTPMQESVGATAARACNWLLKAQIRAQLQSRIGICLYDSCDTWSPLRERFVAKRMHEYYMTEINTWKYDDRILSYPIETEFNVGWSTKPSKEIKKLWNDPEYENDPEWNKQLLAMLGIPA